MGRTSLIVAMPLIKNVEGKVLAQIRNHPEFPEKHNKWEIPGGKVEWEENPAQAVIRETKEETGLDVEVVKMWPEVIVNYWTNKDSGEEIKCTLLSYECKIVGGELYEEPIDPRISKLQFLTSEEINNLEFGTDTDKNLLLEFSKQ